MKNFLISHPLFIFFLLIIHNASIADSIGATKSKKEFPLTTFSNSSINFSEIRNDGARRSSIPTIKSPLFSNLGQVKNIGKHEPVISVNINTDSRAYPLRMLLWHELINDEVGGVPILISYSPLCNSSIVFHRALNNKVLLFENTGRLRHFNTIMFDEKTESWWQQYTGTAIIGDYLGKTLKRIPHRRESFSVFKKRNIKGRILVPKNPAFRKYGTTPYIRMDSHRYSKSYFPYSFPKTISPIDRVIVVENQAWPVHLLAKYKRIKKDNFIISWWPGLNSVHDTRWIPFGRDVGNISVQKLKDGKWTDAIYHESFAFTFSTFSPKGHWNLE